MNYRQALLTLPGLSDAQKASGSEVADAIVTLLDKEAPLDTKTKAGGDVAGKETQLSFQMGRFVEDQAFVMPLVQFLTQNVSKPIPAKFHPAYQAMFQQCLAKITASCSCSDSPPSWQNVLGMTIEESFLVIPARWDLFARLVPEIANVKGCTAEQASSGVFTSPQVLEQFFPMRLLYIWEVMSAVAAGADKLTSSDIRDALGGIRGHMQLIQSILSQEKVVIAHKIVGGHGNEATLNDVVSASEVCEYWRATLVAAINTAAGSGSQKEVKEKLEAMAKDTHSTLAMAESIIASSMQDKAPEELEGAAEKVEAGAPEGAQSAQKSEVDLADMLSLADIRTLWKDHDDTLPPYVLRCVEKSIEACLFDGRSPGGGGATLPAGQPTIAATLAGSTKTKGQVQERAASQAASQVQSIVDVGASSVFAEPYGAVPQLWAKQVSKDLCLHFIGSVSRVANAGALPVAQYSGETFFVNKGHHDSFTSDVFVPAWMIDEAGPDEVAQEKEGKVAIMQVVRKKMTLPISHHYMGRKKVVVMELTVFALVPIKTSIGLEKVKLYREPCDEMVEKPAKAKTLKKSPQASNRGRSSSTGTPSEWVHAKHLLR